MIQDSTSFGFKSGSSRPLPCIQIYNPYTINPAKADIPINPIGEIPFFRTFLEPKYTVPRTIVIIIAVVSNESAPGLPTLCCKIIKTPVARMIPMMHGFNPRRTACT